MRESSWYIPGVCNRPLRSDLINASGFKFRTYIQWKYFRVGKYYQVCSSIKGMMSTYINNEPLMPQKVQQNLEFGGGGGSCGIHLDSDDTCP